MKDLTGQRFERLVAVRATEQRKNGSVVWECTCDCGATVFTPSAYLCSGWTRSCGCLQQQYFYGNAEEKGPASAKDLIGQCFGRLTVIDPSEKRVHQAVLWECACDCGNTVFVMTSRLKSGMTKSCGCKGKGKPLEKNV